MRKIECLRVYLPSAPNAPRLSHACRFRESLVPDNLKKANPTNGHLQGKLEKASYGLGQKQAASPLRSSGMIAASKANKREHSFGVPGRKLVSVHTTE